MNKAEVNVKVKAKQSNAVCAGMRGVGVNTLYKQLSTCNHYSGVVALSVR